MYALGERKTRLFRQALQKGIDPAGAPKRFRTAVAARTSVPFCTLQDLNIISMSASTGCGRGAQATGKAGSGTDLEAARRLGVEPSRAMLFEDSLIGVEAGKRGGFGCLVGIDHGQQRGALRRSAPMSSSKTCEKCI